jgi:DNA repair exonuclease SbcCD ATPase subunit
MEREVRERFERMEALLHAGIERGNQMDAQFNERMDRAEKRMELSERRLDRAEQRMEKFDLRLEATRKLVEAGMKIVVRMEERHRALEETVRELAKSQKAFLDSLRKGGNGSRRVA